MPTPDDAKPAAESRGRYRHFLAIPTRWSDNDVYGHVNNVVYYSYFDTVVNTYLIGRGALDIERSPVIGLAVESLCTFKKEITYPETIDAGPICSPPVRRRRRRPPVPASSPCRPRGRRAIVRPYRPRVPAGGVDGGRGPATGSEERGEEFLLGSLAVAGRR